MALQQLTIADTTSNNTWFKKSAVKVMFLFVAGLLFTAVLYNRSANINGQLGATPLSKKMPACPGNTSNAKDTQSKETPSFSIMPGGFSRFLQ